MHQKADGEHGQQHEAEGEEQHRPQYAKQIALRDQPAIGVEQGRNEQQEEHVRRNGRVAECRYVRQANACAELEHRQRQRYPFSQCCHGGDAQQQAERDFDHFHCVNGSAVDALEPSTVVARARDATPPMLGSRCSQGPKETSEQRGRSRVIQRFPRIAIRVRPGTLPRRASIAVRGWRCDAESVRNARSRTHAALPRRADRSIRFRCANA